MPKNTTLLEENNPESIKGHRNYCTQPPQFKCMPTKVINNNYFKFLLTRLCII